MGACGTLFNGKYPGSTVADLLNILGIKMEFWGIALKQFNVIRIIFQKAYHPVKIQ
jgi:hypothetical protein